jgi:septal ring factor EnvC (AmiA/AmiB activator)
MIVTCYKTLSSFTTGAFNITREAQQKSRMAQSKVDGTQVMLNESMKTRSEVEKMLEDHKDAFNQKIQENEADLNEIDGKVSSLGSRIADLNQMVIK